MKTKGQVIYLKNVKKITFPLPSFPPYNPIMPIMLRLRCGENDTVIGIIIALLNKMGEKEQNWTQ